MFVCSLLTVKIQLLKEVEMEWQLKWKCCFLSVSIEFR